MPDFEFQPWERLTPDVTDGDAHACIAGDEEEWLLRLCGELWFVRKRSHSVREWHHGLQHFLAPSDNPTGIWEVPPLEYMRKHWKDLEMTLEGARLFQIVSENVRIPVAWIPDKGWSAYANLNRFFCDYQTAPFLLETRLPIEETPSSVLFEMLQSEYLESESDLRFSVQFAALPHAEREITALELCNGTPQYCARVIQAALSVFSYSWPPHRSEVAVTFRLFGEKRQFVLDDEQYFTLRERAILGRILRHFGFYEPIETPTMRSAIRTRLSSGNGRSFSIASRKPSSAHEFMEALVELRQWLQENWPGGLMHLSKTIPHHNV